MAGRGFETLDVERLMGLFALIDAELAGEPEPVQVIVVGGAALAFRWRERTTSDVDLLEEIPRSLRRAAAAVADRAGMDGDWLNDAARVGAPAVEPVLHPLYRGERFAVFAPDAEFLLVTKVAAGRVRDLDDAVRLSEDAGVGSAEEILELFERAYPHEPLLAKTEAFAAEVAAELGTRAARRGDCAHRRPVPGGDSTDLGS